MRQHISRLKTGIAILYASEAISALTLAFMPLFLKDHGYDLGWIVAMWALAVGISLLPLFLLRKYDMRRFIAMGFMLFAGAELSLFFLSPLTIPLYALMFGMALVIFWVPLNYLFFISSAESTHATDSSLYSLIDMFGIVFPPLGALLIGLLSYRWLFGLGALLYLLGALMVLRYAPSQQLHANPRRAMLQYKRLRLITGLEGSLGFFTDTVIPIYALLFFDTASSLSVFLSYLGIISFVIAIVLSHHSDRTQRRKAYLFIMFALMAVSIISLAFVSSTLAWIIAVGVFITISRISWPIRAAIAMDNREKDVDYWVAREICLNTGRLFTLAITAVLFLLKLYWLVFLLFGAIAIAYPFLVQKKLQVR